MRGRKAAYHRMLGLLACLLACPAALAAAASDSPPAQRFELAAFFRTLGHRDMREPGNDAPSLGLVPERGGWVRDWRETRAYVRLSYRLVDTEHLEFAPGWHMGTAVGRFEAKNAAIGFCESWETRPALLWGPAVRLTWRRAPGRGAFLLLSYELFLAGARDGSRSVSPSPAAATQNRDAFFSWTSHEATAALGYDWGRAAVSAGVALTAFCLDKRLPRYTDPAAGLDPLLGAILAASPQSARYYYAPQSPVAPHLSLTLRPWPRWSIEATLRPAGQPDLAVGLRLSF